MQEIDDANYISLTTFKRDGTPKATPVWVVGSGGEYQFYTGVDAWKTKRLRNNPAVEVQVCDMRGRVAPGATVFTGTGRPVDDPHTLSAVKAAVKKKYGLWATVIGAADKLKSLIGRGTEEIAIELHLQAP